MPDGNVTVVLDEYQSRDLPLSATATSELAQLAGKRLAIGVGAEPGTWRLTATEHVGSLITSDLTILVRPKIPLQNLFWMLDVDLESMVWGRTPFPHAEDDHLLAVFAEFFARTLDGAIGAGLVRSYRSRREPLVVLRGRVATAETFRRPGLAPPVPCDYDEFTADNPENRYLKAAVTKLLRVPGVRPLTRRSLRQVLVRFEEVADTRPRPDDLDLIHLTRLNRHYAPALRLARLVHANLGLMDRPGGQHASSFMLDMNELFEHWVTHRLRLALRGRLVVVEKPTLHLGCQGTVSMYPDLVFRHDDEVVYVGDVKYKLTTSGLGRADDYYQLLAYTTVLGLPEGVLIYCRHPGASPEREVVVQRSGQRLRTHALDLSGSWTDIHHAIVDLANDLARAADHRRAALSTH